LETWTGRFAGGIAGIVFAVGLVVVNFMVPAPPMVDDPSGDFLDYLADNRTILMVQSSLIVLLTVPLALFLPWFGRYVHNLEPQERFLGLIAAVALAAGWALAVFDQMIFGGLAFVSESTLGADEARNLTIAFTVAWKAPLGAFALAAAASGLVFAARQGWLRWLGWLGIVAAALNVLGQFAWADDGLLAPDTGAFIAFLLVLAYLLLVAIGMTREARAA
jgi:hypothetical protein